MKKGITSLEQQEITDEMLADVGPVINRILRIDQIEPHPENYNEHPEAQLRDLMASDARFNQVRSIVVQAGAPGQYLLVAGHGYTEARKERGRVYVKADIIPADWTSEQVIGYLITDNLSARKGISNDNLLGDLIRRQKEAGFELASIGADDALLDDLLAKSEPPPSLDDLADEYGDEPDEESFWPVIRLKVAPDTKERFESLMAQITGENEAEKFAHLLSVVDIAALDAVDDEDA